MLLPFLSFDQLVLFLTLGAILAQAAVLPNLRDLSLGELVGRAVGASSESSVSESSIHSVLSSHSHSETSSAGQSSSGHVSASKRSSSSTKSDEPSSRLTTSHSSSSKTEITSLPHSSSKIEVSSSKVEKSSSHSSSEIETISSHSSTKIETTLSHSSTKSEASTETPHPSSSSIHEPSSASHSSERTSSHTVSSGLPLSTPLRSSSSVKSLSESHSSTESHSSSSSSSLHSSTTASSSDVHTSSSKTGAQSTTSSTSSSSGAVAVFGTPVTSSVPKPTSKGDDQVIPCNLWFFSICIKWEDIDIGGWEFNLPKGIRPPGPPPGITFPPELHINIETIGVLPPWPQISVGPDAIPTFPPKPSDQPDNQCKTKSAQICMTSTSSAKAISTCATIYGCDVSDSATTVSSTTKSSASSSSSCSGKTATDVTYYVSYGTDSTGSTTETTTYSTAKTVVTACSATPVTSTVSSAPACSASGCAACAVWSYTDTDGEGGDGGDDNPPGSDANDIVYADSTLAAAPVKRRNMPIETMSSTFDVDESRLRKVEAPATTPDPLHPLFERTMTEGRQSAAFGKCKLPAGKAITFSDYPAVAEYSLPQYKEASSYFVVSRRSTDADGKCVAGRIYSTSTLAGVSAAQGGATYAMSASGKGVPYVNSDHVYELRILGDFFSYALGQSDAPTCDDFNTAYVNDGKLQSLFDLTPNVNHPNFAAIDQHINLKKGNYYSMGTERVNSNDGYQKYITKLNDNLQNFALVAGLMNEKAMITQFQVVHQRIWDQLTVWDQLDASCGNGVKMNWADTYSKWMKEYLSERNNFYTNAASTWYDLFSSTSSSVSEANEKSKDKAGYKPTPLPVYSHLTASYPPASFNIPIDAMVSLAPAPEKRAVTSPAACSLSLSLSTKGSAKPTSLSTKSTLDPKSTSISTKASSSQISKPVSASSKVITSPLSTRTSTRPSPSSSTVKSPPPSSSSKPPVTSSPPPPVTSSTPPPPPPPSSTISLTPMVTNPPVCHDAGSEPGHNDVHDYEVHNIAVAYCGNPDYASANSTGPWLQLNMFLADGTDYRVEAAWIPGCHQQNMNPSVMLPLGDGQIDCVDILMQTYTGCNNGGIGGYMNVGCMRYDLVAGLGPTSDMPANDGWIVVEDENPSNDGGRPEQLEQAEDDDGFPF